ncbi:MAG TPA: hypothetical protein VHK67_05220 [Rhabdochlamydiaceae bacterium]|jgi:hypothetical protein|nr:hypothetical protein [Rhabdochlamydiaceae bacterium]
MAGAIFRSTVAGAGIGIIAEFLLKDDYFPALENTGWKAIAGAISGLVFGVLKQSIGHSFAIPFVLFTLVGITTHKPYSNESSYKLLKRCIAFSLIGAYVGYGLHSIPNEFWNRILVKIQFN